MKTKNCLLVSLAVRLLASLSAFLLVSSGLAAELEQRQGKGVVRIEAERIENGRVEVRLSGKLDVTMSVEGPATLEVQSAGKAAAGPDWEISQKSKPQTSLLASGQARWQQRITLEPAKAGDVALALEPLKYREDPDSPWQEIAWKAIPVHVSTEILEADVRELRDATPPEQLPPEPVWRVPIAWAVLPLVLTGLALGVVYYRRHARRQPALPADRWALRELDLLQTRPLSSPEEIEHFHTLLSDVIRKYMELRFQLPAPEQTTAEFVAALQKSTELTAEQKETLRDLLEHCDLAKFARVTPLLEECEAALKTARTLVEQTALQEKPDVGLAKIDKNRQADLR